jgi:cytochrome c oxidase cbb3-type subunit III
MNSKKEKSKNPATTGHKWDDNIEEYNTPAPRWWLITWLITIIWSLIYFLFFPTLPNEDLEKSKKWTSYSQLEKELNKADEDKRKYLDFIKESSLEEIKNNPKIFKFAISGGKSLFKENCAACHGTGAQGGNGFPNLNDDDWLWGGSLADIYQTIQYGIRSKHPKTRNNNMPKFGLDEILTMDEIEEVTNYVLSLSNKNIEYNSKGKEIFHNQCSVCHGKNAKGNQELGAPNLTDAIWLYGKEKEDIIKTIYYSRNGVMTAWIDRLSDEQIKQLTIYTHSLGGGEEIKK